VRDLLLPAIHDFLEHLITRGIIDLLETVLVSKFSKLSRQEIQSMFLLSDIKQTRVYQEAKEEGRQEEASSMLQRQLSKRFGKISAPQSGSLRDRRLENINSLSLEQLEDLGEALLDFSDIADLDNWLQSCVTG